MSDRISGLESRGSGLDGPSTDAALEREIENVLSVDPSPEFLARVRARVSADPAPSRATWYLSWMAATAAVAAAALVVAVSVGRSPSDTSGVPASAATSVVGTDPSSAPRQTARGEASAQLGAGPPTADRPARQQLRVEPASTVREVRRHTFPEVLVSAAEVKGFETLLGRVRRGDLTIAIDEESADSVEPQEPTDLVIAPIKIRPLDSATVTEGAEE